MARTTGGLALCAVATMVFMAQPRETLAQDDFQDACAEMQAGTLPVCTRLHATGAALRLPADGAAIYGAVDGGAKFVTASGRRVAMTDAVRSQVERGYASTIYKATISGDQITDLEPVLGVRSAAIMERSFGSRVLVGKISVRTSPRSARLKSFSGRPTLPLVIEVSRRARGRRIRGTILNADRAVRLGKRCAPALSRHRRNPLGKGFTRRIAVERRPGMHVPFQDALVFVWSRDSSGMGTGLYPSLASLFGHGATGKRWKIVQHGVPSAGPALSLSFARPSARPRRC